MRLPTGFLVAIVSVAFLCACSGIPGIYVVDKANGQGSSGPGPAKFNATAYANGIWASKVVPTAEKNAVALVLLLQALHTDQAAASKQYGRQAGSGAPYSFLVKGSGTVLAVNSDNAVGSIQVNVPGAGKTDVNLVIGPAFVGTAIRDAVGFIDFNQFINQIDYADAATALNIKVKTGVVNNLDLAGIKGKKVGFTGAFQLLDPSSILITPVTLQVAP